MAFHLNGYSNFHDDNQDWIVSKIKSIEDTEAHTEELAEAAQASADASQASAEASQLSADASQASAEASQQSASDSQESAEASAASEMSAKNYADHIADPVSGLVTGWLDDHVTPTTPIVDDTLTIQGAAADAKAAGDRISVLEKDTSNLDKTMYHVEASALGTSNKVLIFAKAGDILNIKTADGSPFTITQIYFTQKDGTQVAYWGLAGYDAERTVQFSDTAADVYYAYLHGGTAQNIIITNNTSYYNLHPQIENVTTAVKDSNVDGNYGFETVIHADRKKAFLECNIGDVITFSTTDGSPMTVNNAESYAFDKTTRESYWGLNGYGSSRQITASRVYYYFTTTGGTAQEIKVTNETKKQAFLKMSELTEVVNNSCLPKSWTENLNEIQKTQGDKFTFAVQTDTHMTGQENATYVYPLKNLTNRMGFDFICNLGDINRGYEYDTTADSQTAITNIMHRYVDNLQCPMLYALGNHEDGSLYTSAQGTGNLDLDESLLINELDAKIMKLIANTGQISHPYNNFYYYKDFPTVRVIVLNTHDVDWTSLGSPSGVDVNSHIISTAQIAWLENTALDTDKAVLILCHTPLLSNLTSDVPVNASSVITALKNFKTGGGTLIGVMCGHTHVQNTYTSEGILHVVFDNGGNFAEIVMVDVSAGTITTKMIGDKGTAVDRSFTF